MKVCEKCGCLYTDDNMFCEKCGTRLTPQMQNPKVPNHFQMPEKKKVNPLLFLIPIAVILVILALLFLFRDKLPFFGKKADTQDMVQQEEDAPGKDSPEDLEEKGSTVDSKEEDSKKEQTDKKQESKEVSYAGAEINGVDNAYVQIAGTVAQEKGGIILKLEKASSVCAYDGEEKIVQKENVDHLALDGNDMEEYLGDKVEIKGKLFADISGEFSLQVVKTDVKQQAQEETNSANHRYQLIQADVTWQEAFSDCISRGGYLAQINSEEEYRSITSLIESEDMQNVHFYLGGRRDLDGQDYYWVDAKDSFVGEMLNPEGFSWAAGHWMENEPSFTSEGDTELYMNLVYYQENWVFNDVPLDISVYYSGKIGYICEFDE